MYKLHNLSTKFSKNLLQEKRLTKSEKGYIIIKLSHEKGGVKELERVRKTGSGKLRNTDAGSRVQ